MTQVLSGRALKITERQREVVELIAAGLSNDEVGVRLGISPRTAKAHCGVLRQKLGVSRRRRISERDWASRPCAGTNWRKPPTDPSSCRATTTSVRPQ